MKKLLSLITLCILMVLSLSFTALAGDEITILFTSDIHDYLYPVTSVDGDALIEHGGAARLKTLLDENSGDNTIYIDGGDFSMGTLIQAAYSTDAYELRNLGLMGCEISTFGNHEFDFGAEGLSDMLNAAKNSGDELPQILLPNIDLTGELTDEQKELKDAFNRYGVTPCVIRKIAGQKVGFFGLMGYDCIECTQTDLSFMDYKTYAKMMTEALKNEGCDIIIALSHTGTDSATEGEDIDLANEVQGIDIILSGHSHSYNDEPIYVGNTVIVTGWDYLKGLGKLSFTKDENGINVTDYEMLRIDSSVDEDKETAERIESYKEKINGTYLAEENVTFDEVIAHSGFNLISLDDMYATHQEYTIGDLIADAYLYEAEKNGINDIDVALVGLGTIRGTIKKGNVTVADAFEICSLGVGSDGSAGHPLVATYISGKELKLLTELDASLGTLVSSIKMSYSGLEYQFNIARPILDRVTRIQLVRRDGTYEEIDDDKLYKVCVNMYAANMLGMLNGLTKGVLSITPKYADGTPVTDFYSCALINTKGNEIKEWVAFKNYLMSFEKNADGIPEIPTKYESQLGRKYKYRAVSLDEMTKMGTATNILSTVNIIGTAIVLFIVLLIILFIKRIKKRNRKFSKE